MTPTILLSAKQETVAGILLYLLLRLKRHLGKTVAAALALTRVLRDHIQHDAHLLEPVHLRHFLEHLVRLFAFGWAKERVRR